MQGPCHEDTVSFLAAPEEKRQLDLNQFLVHMPDLVFQPFQMVSGVSGADHDDDAKDRRQNQLSPQL
jgi:hypothetical protein